jgi:4-diphosphocytidyl-2C-methyl-D-erythritol kinase
MAALLIHPGFGIATAWAYRELARFPAALRGTPGRAAQLISALQTTDIAAAGRCSITRWKHPPLRKYPLLQLYQEFLSENGVWATLMSGSGSTTFAIADTAAARALEEKVQARFGPCWTLVAPWC